MLKQIEFSSPSNFNELSQRDFMTFFECVSDKIGFTKKTKIFVSNSEVIKDSKNLNMVHVEIKFSNNEKKYTFKNYRAVTFCTQNYSITEN